jgi:hypothetical protein
METPMDWFRRVADPGYFYTTTMAQLNRAASGQQRYASGLVNNWKITELQIDENADAGCSKELEPRRARNRRAEMY